MSKKQLNRYQRAGFNPDQIVFTGQSAGGFASLLAQAGSPETIGRVIAFGPAFANKLWTRGSGEERANVILKARIANAKGLNALVYSYDEDVYERPKDLTGWSKNPGINIFAVKGYSIEGVSCGIRYAHHFVFDECFESTQLDRMIDFIANRN